MNFLIPPAIGLNSITTILQGCFVLNNPWKGDKLSRKETKETKLTSYRYLCFLYG